LEEKEMLNSMRPEALKALLASPVTHDVANAEQVRRDAAAVAHIMAAQNTQRLRKAAEAQARGAKLVEAATNG
jgi:hypothetical protein